MKRFLLVLAVAMTGLAVIPTDAVARGCRARTEVRIGFGRDRPWFGEVRHPDRGRYRSDRNRCDDRGSSWGRQGQQACDHRGARQITQQVWVPATIRTVVVGYSPCGEPRYDRVRVPGHWDTVVTGHRCGTCGAGW